MSAQLKVHDRQQTIKAMNFIEGKWEFNEEKVYRRLNPADTSDVVADAPDSSAATARRAIEGAAKGWDKWRRMTPPERGKIALRAAQILEAEMEPLAQLMTREQGKAIAESRVEVKRGLDIVEYAAGMGRRMGGQTLPSEIPDVFCYTMRQPIGPVSLISPWNFPVAIPCWKIAPAFVCGCPIVFKPSPFVPAAAARVVEIFLEAGMPPEAISLVHGGPAVGEQMITHPLVAGISFTGSTKVGKAIHATASQLMKKTQLEMGGKNPQIVLRDADIGLAVDHCTAAALDVTGQRCTCTSRVLVEKEVAEEFTDRFVDRFKKVRVGPGHRSDVDMGPLVDMTRLKDVEAFVERAKKEGAKVLTGGERPQGLNDGAFYRPTVMNNIKRDYEIAREEVFGPVVGVVEVGNLDEAMSIANDVDYGLAASIFTRDLKRAFSFIDKIEAGMIHINRPTLGGFSHFPFGGLKNSSFGPREIGDDTVSFYTSMKSVYINHA